MTSALMRLANRIVQRPRTALILALALGLAAGAVGLPLLGELHFSTSDLDASGSQSVHAARTIEASTGIAPAPTIFALLPTNALALSPTGQRSIVALADALLQVPGVARVGSYPQASLFERTALQRYFSSRSEHWAFVAAAARAGVLRSDRASRLARALLARFPPRSHVLLGGSTIADEELGALARGQLEHTELWVLPLLALLLGAIFRRPAAAALAFAIGVLALLETLAALRVLHGAGVHVSLFCLPVASGLALGLGIDYGLLGISRFREEARAHADEARACAPGDAARATLATAGRTILFSALTIGCCGAALVPVSVPLVSSGGLAVALCAVAAAFNALVLLPAVCVPFARRVQTSGRGCGQTLGRGRRQTPVHERGSELWGSLAVFVTRRPAPIALVVGACLIALGVPALGLRFHGVDVEALPHGAGARTAAAVLQDEFEPAVSDELVSLLVHAPRTSRAAVVRYKERVAGLPEVRDTHEATAIAPGLWQIELASRGARLSSTSVALVRRLRGMRAPFPVEVSSPSASYLDQRASLSGALPAILLAIALGTGVPLLVMTRSLVLPLKTLLLNALTVAATFGLVVLLFQKRPLMGVFADGSSGFLETAQPILMLSAVFGLSTDYNVFVISRIQEARSERRSERAAIADGPARSGPIVTAAAFVLCCTLAAFASSSIMLIRETALGMAIAVAIDATLVRALLLPALMALLGRYNWWLPTFRIGRVRGLFGYSRPDVDSKARTRSGHG